MWWWQALDGHAVLLRSDRDRDNDRDKGDNDARDVPSPTFRGSAEQTADHDPASVPESPRDAVAVPLREAGLVKSVLVVCGRSFEKETFGNEDVQVFETLAAHAGVAVERAHTVTDLKRLADERAYDALHDPLSGLLNRRAFNEAVAYAMQDHSGATRPVASGVVLLLDLDDFKDVNDTLGHSAGDSLITVSANRLEAHAAGLVARLGGDEFAVLLPGFSIEDGLDHAHQLHAVLAQPVPLGDVQLTVSASIGVAQFSPLTESAEDLLAQADVAMYTAKSDRSGVALYRPEAGDSTARRLSLAADLPTALERRDIELWYQPQADASTGDISGFEALVRWNHPKFGMIPPPEIIAVAHRTGRMRGLTNALIDQALEARQSSFEAGHDLHVSVNVTPRDVSDPMLVSLVERALAATGTPASALVLEITESDAMKDPERTIAILEALSQLGVMVSIDDFGTGYSSLAYLDQLPVREVKIDQSFVSRLAREPGAAAIVGATIGLAHVLGLRVVAEGVENELARTLVRDLGVDLFQGYGLARPMPGGDVLSWLARREHNATTPALRLVEGSTTSQAR